MSHLSQRDYVGLVAAGLPSFFRDVKVLEIGSLNINGSVRDFFTNCQYLGIDIAPGRGVDVVCEGQRYDAPDNSCDQVISCEVMEHNPFWKETFNNMTRVCRPGGLVTMTCATTGRPEHGTTRSTPTNSPLTVEQGWDYYRNLTGRDFAGECDLEKAFAHYRLWVNWASFDLCFLGLKRAPNIDVDTLAAWNNTTRAIDAYITKANNLKICKYRALMARMGGDKWFEAMRNLTRKLHYIHNG